MEVRARDVPSRESTDEIKIDEGTQCPICFVKRRTYSLLKLNFGHQFCKECLASHLERRKQCPYCSSLDQIRPWRSRA